MRILNVVHYFSINIMCICFSHFTGCETLSSQYLDVISLLEGKHFSQICVLLSVQLIIVDSCSSACFGETELQRNTYMPNHRNM